ncbi:hypothetical protein NXZ77_10385 [Lysinibacillus boronitolerans]|uniref:hypothetical protein n=2 Tax=Bacillaceae TaxID=186817 RepID=UPI0021621527|nr:hypothetical protein [Lysinibacillus boronitolerans]MCS1391980.1 hypothetical protein [Lysinibacillus boronitolerans]
MFKLGETVEHETYGRGKIVNFDSQDKSSLIVEFEEAHEVFIRDIIDEDYHYEDNSRFEKRSFINVYTWDLKKLRPDYKNSKGKKVNESYISNCHSCEGMVSHKTHPRCETCGWYKCECGSCGCNYKRSLYE